LVGSAGQADRCLSDAGEQFPIETRSDTNHEKALDFWQGGSRRPGAIFQSGNRDGDIAIHPDD
jgi:hypothetical protein